MYHYRWIAVPMVVDGGGWPGISLRLGVRGNCHGDCRGILRTSLVTAALPWQSPRRFPRILPRFPVGCHGCYHGDCHGQNRGTCCNDNRGICRGGAISRGTCGGFPRWPVASPTEVHESSAVITADLRDEVKFLSIRVTTWVYTR